MIDAIAQLNEQKRKVDFDSYDLSVKELINMFSEGIIDIAPQYQRQFRWGEDRQSKFIESVLLGIPIPSLFMAANPDGKWEVIDGVQRLSTLIHFAGSQTVLDKLKLKEPLRLQQLDKLDSFEEMLFLQMPPPVQLQFLLKPLRVTTLNDKSDVTVRFDLFERLNTGGVLLTAQEIRSCIFRGEFSDFLERLSQHHAFRRVVKVPKEKENDGTREELVLRFFAFLLRYESFDHSVQDFLNNFMKDSMKSFNYVEGEAIFAKVFESLAPALPNGIRRKKLTPVNLYEAVTVGAALALQESGKLDTNGILNWMVSKEITDLTTGATNSNPMVVGRIEYCRDRFLGK